MIEEVATPARPPGRPRGKAKVSRQQNLRLHDIALMRAIAQGMDLRRAAQRYLPEIHADVRVIHGHLAHVVELTQTILEGMQVKAQARALALSCLRQLPTDQESQGGELTDDDSPGTKLPTLDAFAEEIGADDFSEAELIELYKERYGADVATGSALPSTETERPTKASEPSLRVSAADTELALDGLTLVQSRGLMVPKARDPVDLWFSSNLADHLKTQGAFLIYNLMRSINLHGKHWYRRFPGIGLDRARRLVAWLVDHEPYLGMAVHERCRWSDGQPSEQTASEPGFAEARLHLDHGANLPGLKAAAGTPSSTVASPGSRSEGWSLRAGGHNALHAVDDLQAVKTWLETLGFKSEHTRKAYARDVQRLLLWAHQRGKTLSTLSVNDASAHARFLREPPEHWVVHFPVHRDSVDWRPMRGALSPASTARALAAIGHLYGFLMETGYLVANPFSRIKAPRSAGPLIDTLRSFSSVHLEVLGEVLRAMQQDATRRRLQALLMLLESTGLRISELERTWADVQPISPAQMQAQSPADGSRLWCLRVLGKGGKERLIPLKPHVLEALERHRGDRQALVNKGVLPDLRPEETPLISVIARPVHSDLANTHGGLSTSGIHRVIKALYQQASEVCEDPEMRSDFQRATTHWLRHTFAHSVLKASGQDLPVTQQLLGHGSIATTGIYVKASLVDRLRAVQAMPDVFMEGKAADRD